MNHEQEERTTGTILTAYGSYHAAMLDILNNFALAPELAGEIRRLRNGYDQQWSIDSHQNIHGETEESEKTIRKACQYAQAFLIHDLRPLYPRLADTPGGEVTWELAKETLAFA